MGPLLNFPYYYVCEGELKRLYGLMLDRISLSLKNGWLDAENRAYMRWFLGISTVVFDEKQIPVSAIKSFSDITEQKRKNSRNSEC